MAVHLAPECTVPRLLCHNTNTAKPRRNIPRGPDNTNLLAHATAEVAAQRIYLRSATLPYWIGAGYTRLLHIIKWPCHVF